MTPPKLSDDDKQAVIDLYRLPEETTTSISNRYGVSPTTISRILKSGLPENEYEALMQQKRSLRGATYSTASLIAEDADQVAHGYVDRGIADDSSEHELSSSHDLVTDPMMDTMEESMTDEESLSQPRKRRRSSAPVTTPDLVKHSDLVEHEHESCASSSLSDVDGSEEQVYEVNAVPDAMPIVVEDDFLESTNDIGLDEDLDEGIESDLEVDEVDEVDVDDSDDDQDDLFDDDFEDDDSAEPGSGIGGLILRRSPDAAIQVLPLSEAVLPRTAYLVVDRTSDLVTHPLKDFGDLGRIPVSETQETTLPIFDNHRIARRFSKKNQKVVKIPDGNLLTKTVMHLQSKGITRLLIDGQVYSI